MYCGTDIIEVSRLKDAIESNENFKFKVFSEKEIDDIDKCSENLKYQRYAGRFAAKEAVYKAVSRILIENNIIIEFKEIEILNDETFKRRPKVNILNGDLNKILTDYNIDVSISHIKSNATAICVINLK